MKKHSVSLKMGLLTTILICWLVPIVIVVALAGVLLGNSYERSVQQEIDTSAQNALRQVQTRFSDAIAASKAVSYDGVVRSAYRAYQSSGDDAQMYRSINDYLNQSFSREEKYKAVFITFYDEQIDVSPYVLSSGTTGYAISRTYRENTQQILEEMAPADTAIRFLVIDGELYMARNLLDSHFTPYACVVMMIDARAMFQPLDAISRISNLRLQLDAWEFCLDEGGSVQLLERQDEGENEMVFTAAVDEHEFSFTATAAGFDLWKDTPWLGWAVAAVALLVLPLLAVVIFLFYYHVTKPMQTLAEANGRVQAGQRGYQIEKTPANVEFGKLYDNFNAMSTELKNQFDRAYLEQQATQRARIKALQSQINPHFLNNTLEIINWEARLADNERVCAMIEALSTMLGAALDRDGRTQIPLSEELGYVDAYLYIIKERLGERFRVTKQIDETILDQLIPRLILQPIVENAVEHDITTHRGGELLIRACREGERMVLEVEHDGTMTEEDRENIRILLSEQVAEGSRVGLRNVSQRLKLIYGKRGSLTIEEPVPGKVLARVSFPVD